MDVEKATVVEARGTGEDGRTSSTLGAGFNVVCCIVGGGLLQLPYAFRMSGWVAIPILVTLCVMATYTGHILIKCLQLGKTVNNSNVSCLETYGDIGQAAFGSAGRLFVNVQQHLTLILVATVYNLIAGMNLIDVFPSAEWLTLDLAIVMAAVVVWFHVFLKTMGEVAILSSFNIAITVALAAVVIVEAMRHPPGEPVKTEPFVRRPMEMGAAFASMSYAFGVHTILPTVYRSMAKPAEYTKMLAWSMATVMMLYLPVSVVCYARYGDQLKSPVYETAAMSTHLTVKVVVALLTVHVLGGYAIVINPPEVALEAALGVDGRRWPLLWRLTLRTGFVVITCAVSIVMKHHFPPLLDIVGAFTCLFTEFVLPCAFYIQISRKVGSPLSVLELCWNALIMGVALLGSVFGAGGAMKEIMAEMGGCPPGELCA
jgi:vesicular inhibitory amino acid transporter